MMIFSVQIVTAMAFAGDLGFDPENDTLQAVDGSEFKFVAPTGDELPEKVFTPFSRSKFGVLC